MDITDRESVAKVLRSAGPELVLLPAAMTNVDQCEREPDRAYGINMEGTLNVAAECLNIGAKLVYVSTDYVFNGMRPGRYHEFDTPDPLGVYARSKLEGERVTMDASPDNLVCRVSVVYGWNRVGRKDNFVTWIVRSLSNRQPIRLYHDQRVSPTYAPAAARDILDLALKGASGAYHTSGPDCLSRYDIGLMVAEEFGLNGKLITAVSTEEMPTLATRPARSCLAVDQAEAELERPMLSLKQGLEEMKKIMPTSF
jgi:dTDP-4-dehydrorhamnose reductase